LPWSVESEVVLLERKYPGLYDGVVGGVGKGRKEARVGDECFVFVVWDDGEAWLRG
jgi:hypothetical protein